MQCAPKEAIKKERCEKGLFPPACSIGPRRPEFQIPYSISKSLLRSFNRMDVQELMATVLKSVEKGNGRKVEVASNLPAAIIRFSANAGSV
jgi:hypothetical protein